MTEAVDTRRETAPEGPARWGDRRREHRIYKLAALVVIVAGIVFIFAVVFWTGLIIGAHGGHGHHRGHYGSGYWHSQMYQPGASNTPATGSPTPTSPSPARP